jgi:hypothetical protein
LDNTPPARSIGPRAMNEDNFRKVIHPVILLSVVETACV